MELVLTFSLKKGNLLPINYQYALSHWLTETLDHCGMAPALLSMDSPADAGEQHPPFTFSQLNLRPYEVSGNQVRLLGKTITLTVRFLLDINIMKQLKDVFLGKTFYIHDRMSELECTVTDAVVHAPPHFKSVMRYHCLSPICLTRPRGHAVTYLSPMHEGYGKVLIENLLVRQRQLASIRDDGPVETPYRFRLLNKPRKKGIHIKSHMESQSQLIGYLFHFELAATAELHEIGYCAGFGERNHLGFGCCKIL